MEPNGRVRKINDLLLSKVTSTKLKLQNVELNFHSAVFYHGYTFQATRYSAIKRDVASNRSIFVNDLEIKIKLQIAAIRQACIAFILLKIYIKYVKKNKLRSHKNGLHIRRSKEKTKYNTEFMRP